MGFALPSGVINTDSVYFYADATLELGPHVKQVSDQTLFMIDYSKVEPPFSAYTYQFAVDVSSNPALVVSYPQINVTNEIFTFLVSGGLAGQQYNISIIINTGTDTRTDILTINIPSSGDCDCETINRVPSIYTQLPLGEPTQGYVNSAVRYFWGNAPPNNPNVMDQWYNISSNTLYEWATDGTNFFWQTMMSSNLVTEAPQSGLLFSRYNGYWVPDIIQTDAPSDGNSYARFNASWRVVSPPMTDAPAIGIGYWRYNNAWVRDPIQIDAPNDGQTYMRSNQAWLQTPKPFPDAPSTGQFYSRINTNWQSTPIQVDAPPDGQFYARNNNSWMPLLGLNDYLVDAPTDGTLYGRLNGAWAAAYSASNPANYINATQGAALVAPMMPRAGGTFSGGVSFTAGAIFAGPANLAVGGGQAGQVISAVGGGGSTLAWAAPGTPEAPMTGVAYARENGTWVPTAAGAGVPEAPTDGTTYSRNDGAWVNLNHTDITDWDATLAPYALTASLPPIPAASTTTPLMDGTAAVGTSGTWAQGDHIHPTDTSRYSASNPSGYQTAGQVTATLTAALGPYALTTAVPVASNALPLIDGTAAAGSSVAFSRADHVHPTDTSRLAVAGGTMTGALILNADPTVALGAATMQYVSNSASNANIDCGTF